MAVFNAGAGGANLNYSFLISDDELPQSPPKPILQLKNTLGYLNKYKDNENHSYTLTEIKGYKQQNTESNSYVCNTKLALMPTISLDKDYPQQMVSFSLQPRNPYVQLAFPIDEEGFNFVGGFTNTSGLGTTNADGVTCESHLTFDFTCKKTAEQTVDINFKYGKTLFRLNEDGSIYSKLTYKSVEFIVLNVDLTYEIERSVYNTLIIESKRALTSAQRIKIKQTTSYTYPNNLNSLNIDGTNFTMKGKLLTNAIIADINNRYTLQFIDLTEHDSEALKITTYNNSGYQLFTFDDESVVETKVINLEGTPITPYNNKIYTFPNDVHNSIVVLPPSEYEKIIIENETDFNNYSEQLYYKIGENNSSKYIEINMYNNAITEYYKKNDRKYLGIQYSTNISESIPIIEDYSDNYKIKKKNYKLKNIYKKYEFNNEEPSDMNEKIWIKTGNNPKINALVIKNSTKPHYIEIQSALISLEGKLYYLDGYYCNDGKITALNTNDYTVASLKDLIEGAVTVIEDDEITKIAPYMFYKYDNLKSINFPSCEDVNIGAFSHCANLTDVSLPAWNSTAQFVTAAATDSSPFCGCTAIQRATIGFRSFTNSTVVTNATSTANATKAWNPFNSAKRALKQINLPNCSIVNSSVFTGYTVLHDAIFGRGSYGSDGIQFYQKAFKGCINLNKIDLGNTFDGYQYIGLEAFADCQNLTSVEGIENVDIINKQAFANCRSLKIEGELSATAIGQYAFQSCSNLEKFIAPYCVSQFGMTSSTETKVYFTANYLPVQGCENLKIFSIPNVDLSNIEIPYNLLQQFSKLEYCDFAQCKSVAAYAFQNLSQLSYVKLSNNYSIVSTYTFQGCAAVDRTKTNYELLEERWEQPEFKYELDENGNPIYGFSEIAQTSVIDENGEESIPILHWTYRNENGETKIQYSQEPLNKDDSGIHIDTKQETKTSSQDLQFDETEEDDILIQIVNRKLNITESTTNQTITRYNLLTENSAKEYNWLYKYNRKIIDTVATETHTKKFYQRKEGESLWEESPYLIEEVKDIPRPDKSSTKYYIEGISGLIETSVFDKNSDNQNIIPIENVSDTTAFNIRKDHIKPIDNNNIEFNIIDNKNILNYPKFYIALYDENQKMLVRERDQETNDPILDENGQFKYIAGGYTGLQYINNLNNQEEGLQASGITTIQAYAFLNCSNLYSVNLPTENTTGFIQAYAFQNCISLERVNAPAYSGINYTAFLSCSKLKELYLSNASVVWGTNGSADSKKLKSMFLSYSNNVFTNNFPSLQTVELNLSKIFDPESNVKNEPGTFENLPLNRAAFNNCTSIGSRAFKNTNLSYINYTFQQIQGGAINTVENFAGNIHIPQVSNINNSAFENCLKLTGAYLKEVDTIGDNAFANCVGIRQININMWGTSDEFNMPKIKTIGQTAFQNLNQLTSIKFASTLTSIGASAFINCTELKDLIFETAIDTAATLFIDSNAFANHNLTLLSLPFQLYSENRKEDYYAIALDAFKPKENYNYNTQTLVIDLTAFDKNVGGDQPVQFWSNVQLSGPVFGAPVINNSNVYPKFRLTSAQAASIPANCTWWSYYSTVLTSNYYETV